MPGVMGPCCHQREALARSWVSSLRRARREGFIPLAAVHRVLGTLLGESDGGWSTGHPRSLLLSGLHFPGGERVNM